MLGRSPRYYVLYTFFLAHFLVEMVTGFIVRTNVYSHCRIGQQPIRFTPSTAQYEMVSLKVAETIGAISSPPGQLIPSSLLALDAMENVTNVLVFLGGILALAAIFFIVLSIFIIPTAAKQIEDLAKTLDPELWREYEQKLEPGETLAIRPDLMQELGNKVLALQNKQLNNVEWNPHEEAINLETSIIPEVITEARTQTDGVSSPNSSNDLSTEGSIDVAVMAKNRWDD
jgi:hypothetical protein